MSKKSASQPPKSNDNPMANDVVTPSEVITTARNAQRVKSKKALAKKNLSLQDLAALDAEEAPVIQLAQADLLKTANDVSPAVDTEAALAVEPEQAIAALPFEYEAVAALPESGAVAWAQIAGAGGNGLLYGALGALAAGGLAGGGGGGGNASNVATANTDVKALPPVVSASLDPASDSQLQGDKLTNNARPAIKGIATAGSKVTVSIDTNGDGIADVVLQTVADETGSWTVTPTNALPEGPITATVIAADANGLQSAPSLVNLVIDTTIAAPDPLLALVSDTGAMGDNITTDHTPTLRGAGAAPGDIITVALDTNNDGVNDMTLVTVADASGQWSVVPTSALAEGIITATVVASDAAGNVSAPAVLTLTVAPILTAGLNTGSDSGRQGDLLTNDTTPTITGVGRPGDIVNVVTPTGEALTATVQPNGAWSVTPLIALPQGGPQEFKASTTDAAGITSTANVLVTVDSLAGLAPLVTISADTNNDGFLNAAELGSGTTVAITVGLPATAVAGDTITVSDGSTTQRFVLTQADIDSQSLATVVT